MTNPLLDTSTLPRFAEILPDHVVPALTELIDRHRQRLDQILSANGEPNFDSVVTPLEEMEHELARVWSPVGHLQSVLGSPEWREAYNEALPMLTEYGTELSQNQRLQQAYSRVEQGLTANTDDARRSAVEHALRDFRLAGVALDETRKSRFREIMRELAAVQANFDHNVQDAADAWLLQIEDEQELAGMPRSAMRRASAEAASRDLEGWVLTLDYPTYDAVMTHCDNRDLRERFYQAWVTRASDEGSDSRHDNSDNIARILALRHEAARLVGFDNYAEYSLATKMAESTDEILDFLRTLAGRSRTAATREIAELETLAGDRIEPWDVAYWLEKLKQEKYSISNEALRQYLPANKVIGGLFALAGKLYGVSIEAREDVTTWHPDATYYEVRDQGGTTIGSFYTDMYARGGKRTGAWIDDAISRKHLNDDATLPVGFLVCNFSPPDADSPSLLTHDDVVTLFHEFGHMLHHLLTRIDYPSIAGINGVPWDAVELPSQFMENFAWNYDVLVNCSGHVETGEALPRALFDRLSDTRHLGAGLAMLRQLEFGLFDMRLHSEAPRKSAAEVLELLDEVRREVSLLQHPAYNRMPHAFSHIFAGGYAAGYYSYKWAEVLAADAFAAFEESGIFDRDTANRFREEILEIGGSRDFMDAYVAFRSRPPEIDALLRQSGIIEA
jgi:oligopeptidase A